MIVRENSTRDYNNLKNFFFFTIASTILFSKINEMAVFGGETKPSGGSCSGSWKTHTVDLAI